VIRAGAPRPPRVFTDRDLTAARRFLDTSGGPDWIAVRKQTLRSDEEAHRIGVRMAARLQAAGHAANRIEATQLMFDLIRRVKRDIALAHMIKSMLRRQPDDRHRMGA